MNTKNPYRVILQIILFALIAWVFIHVMSLLGAFLFLAYPVWWILFPDKKICFLCRLQLSGEPCKHCTHDERQSHRMGSTTMLLNMVFILFFTLSSMSLVYIEYRLISYHWYSPSQTVHINLPSQKTVYQGALFPVELVLDGIERPINAVQLDLSFDRTQLEAVDVITKDSFITLFVEKTIDNDHGFVRISGGVPNPGYDRPIGLVGHLMLRAKQPGAVRIRMLPSSAVLLNDGKGTNVMREYGEFRYLVLPATDKIEAQVDEGAERMFILGAQAEAAKNQFYFYPESDTIYPVETRSEEKVGRTSIHPAIELLRSIDAVILRLITFSF